MPSPAAPSTRRLELTLHKPWFALYFGIKPTVVIAGRGQPAQWGTGTWQVPADATTTLAVYLFNRAWKFGRAQLTVGQTEPVALRYTAPALPIGPGSLR